jgi:hypothetical protein
MTTETPLTPAERAFLDKYSGTKPNPQALEQARTWTQHALATTKMPDVPHIEAIRDALPGTKDKYEAIRVAAFVDNAMVDDPGTDEPVPARQWLESGRDPAPVLAIATSLRYGL